MENIQGCISRGNSRQKSHLVERKSSHLENIKAVVFINSFMPQKPYTMTHLSINDFITYSFFHLTTCITLRQGNITERSAGKCWWKEGRKDVWPRQFQEPKAGEVIYCKCALS